MISFEISGVWWLPNNGWGNKCPGTLTFNPSYGGKLTLTWSHRNAVELPIRSPRTFPVILGTADASDITLKDCLVVDWRRVVGGYSHDELTISVSVVFKGIHFYDVESMAFETLSLTYTFLDDWMNQHILPYEQDHEPPDSLEVSYDEYSIRFHTTSTLSLSRDKYVQLAFHNVTITPNHSLHIDGYRQIVDLMLPYFLTLATGIRNLPSDVIANERDMPNEIKIFYCIPGYESKTEPMLSEHMLFTFKDLVDDPEQYLALWFDNFEEMLSVYELYFHTVYSPSLSSRVSFLLLAQALEAYHREHYGGQYLPSEKYKSVKKELRAVISQQLEGEQKQNLRAAVDHGNKFSLKTRIVDLCKIQLRSRLEGSDFAIVDALLIDVDDFAEKVTATRNYLTHHPKERPKHALTDNEIIEYVPRMRFLLRICFLVNLGFDSSELKRRTISNPEYKYLTGTI